MGEYEKLFGLGENYTLEDLRSAYLGKIRKIVERAKEARWQGFLQQRNIFIKLTDAFLVLYKKKAEPTKRTDAYERAETTFKQGKVAYYEGNYRNAAEMFQEAITINPYKHSYYGFLGLALKNLRSYDAAVKALENAIRLFPINKDYWMSLGEVYLEAGKKTKAMESYAAAYLVDPNDLKPLEKMDEIDPTAFILRKRKGFSKGLFGLFKKK